MIKKAGFTLVEVLVSMMAASIILLGAGGVLIYGTGNFSHYARVAEADRIGEGISGWIEERLMYAEHIKISGDNAWRSADAFIKFGQDGRYYMDGMDLYGEVFYQNRMLGCTIIAEDAPSGVLQMNIWIKDSHGAVLYENHMAINCMNLKLAGEEILCLLEEKDGMIDSADQDITIFYRIKEGETDE